MARVIWFAIAVVCGCSKDNKQEAPGGSTPVSPAAAAGSAPAARAGSPLANAAAKLTDACSLLPADMAKKLIPEATAPQSERYPLRCSVYGKQAALEFSFDSGPPPEAKDGEPVSGIAQGGILQRLAPKNPGDVYITLSLGSDDNGVNHNLHAEVNGLGKDHKDDALELARYVVAHLH